MTTIPITKRGMETLKAIIALGYRVTRDEGDRG